ncbi:MAG: hypothetical protein DM484_06265 [Candidatus Methylumidiphilus alinenensis]|uniref:Uncharacterized protein n=1 Tax=Candidatus Methylumidiphilus alinenensis TaxID=2202197 RepID=A0A2W4RHE6_9GAMM|nr:MAG: hypothetical protein DM484_06265 [Candidatus Methylumidiphilus alinenensis]
MSVISHNGIYYQTRCIFSINANRFVFSPDIPGSNPTENDISPIIKIYEDAIKKSYAYSSDVVYQARNWENAGSPFN